MSVATPYPTQLDFRGKRQIGRWRPFVQWLLAIPQLLIAYTLSVAAVAVVIAGFFAVLITGEYPQVLRDFLVGVYRYNVCVQSYAGLLTDHYPPFSLQAG